MDSRYSRLFKDTTIFAISGFGSKILSFLLIPIYTSVLSTSEYGTADLVLTTTNLLVPILTVSLAEAVLRFSFDKNMSKQKVLSNALLLIYVTTLVLLFLTPFGVAIERTIGEYWIYLVVLYFATAANECLVNYLKSFDRIKLIAISGFSGTLLYLLANIFFLIVFKLGVEGFLLSLIVSTISQLLILIIFGRIWKDVICLSIDRPILKTMLIYSWPLVLSTVAWWINTSIDKYMITYMLSAADNGIYSVAHKIPTLMTMVTTIFSTAWHISAISSAENDDKEQQCVFYSSVFRNYVIVSLFACIVVLALNKPVASLIFAKDFYVAWRYVPMLLMASLFSAYAGFFAAIFRACKKTNIMFYSTVIAAVVNVVANYMFIPLWGVAGAATSTMLSFAVMMLLRLIMLKKLVNIEYDVVRFLFSHCLLIAICVFTSTSSSYNYVSIIIIALMIYLTYRHEYLHLINFANVSVRQKMFHK